MPSAYIRLHGEPWCRVASPDLRRELDCHHASLEVALIEIRAIWERQEKRGRGIDYKGEPASIEDFEAVPGLCPVFRA